MAMVVVPSIDLRAGKVVRLQQGDYARQLNYALDPVETAKSFAAAGAAWMHLVDLDGAKEGRVAQLELIEQIIRATKLNVQVGGGVRSTLDIERLLAAGAKRVVVGTAALENWDWFTDLLRETRFAERIVLAIDAKDGIVATRAWTASSGRTAVEIAHAVSGWPIAGLLYTDVARDGMLAGPNLEQTRRLAEAGRTAVIASGGVGNLDHIRQLAELPIWGVIIGRSLHDGTVNLAEALQLAANERRR